MPLTEADARARAEAEVRAYCGWHIAPEQRETFVLDGSDADAQMLPTLKLVDVHTLALDGAPHDVETLEWSTAGYLRLTGRFPARLRSISVDITHGYETMPLDVQAVVDRLTDRAVDNAGMGQLVQVGQVRVALGADGLPAASTLTELDRFVLDRYRLPPRP